VYFEKQYYGNVITKYTKSQRTRLKRTYFIFPNSFVCVIPSVHFPASSHKFLTFMATPFTYYSLFFSYVLIVVFRQIFLPFSPSNFSQPFASYISYSRCNFHLSSLMYPFIFTFSLSNPSASAKDHGIKVVNFRYLKETRFS
jgi:hypothetical protein